MEAQEGEPFRDREDEDHVSMWLQGEGTGAPGIPTHRGWKDRRRLTLRATLEVPKLNDLFFGN